MRMLAPALPLEVLSVHGPSHMHLHNTGSIKVAAHFVEQLISDKDSLALVAQRCARAQEEHAGPDVPDLQVPPSDASAVLRWRRGEGGQVGSSAVRRLDAKGNPLVDIEMKLIGANFLSKDELAIKPGALPEEWTVWYQLYRFLFSDLKPELEWLTKEHDAEGDGTAGLFRAWLPVLFLASTTELPNAGTQFICAMVVSALMQSLSWVATHGGCYVIKQLCCPGRPHRAIRRLRWLAMRMPAVPQAEGGKRPGACGVPSLSKTTVTMRSIPACRRPPKQ